MTDDNSDEISFESEIDLFLNEELDNLIDLYEDLRYRFPYFLDSCKSTDLTEFIVDFIFHHKRNLTKNRMDMSFVVLNENELDVTLMVLNKYIRRFGKNVVDSRTWMEFCYLNST